VADDNLVVCLVRVHGPCRWRLHPDVAQSVDALLAHSCSTGSSTSDLEVPQHAHAAPGVETQLRSRVESSEGSKLLVSFESGRIPMTAVWADGVPPAAAQFHAGPAVMQHQVGNKRGRTDGGFDGHHHNQYQYQQQHQQQHNQQQQPSKKAKKGAGPQQWMSKKARKKHNHQMVLQRLQKKGNKKQRKAAMAARAAMQRQ